MAAIRSSVHGVVPRALSRGLLLSLFCQGAWADGPAEAGMLVARHYGTAVAPLAGARWTGSFSGRNAHDLALLVTARGSAAFLPSAVVVTQVLQEGPATRPARLDEPGAAGALAVAILHADPAKRDFGQPRAAHLVVHLHRAGLARMPDSGDVKRVAASALTRRLGCAGDALGVRTESSATMYLCWSRGRYRLVGDPDDLP